MNSKRALSLLNHLIQKLSTSSRQAVPRLILFDIDGTLIRGKHQSDFSPIVKATATGFNNSNITRKGVKFSGKTDRGIIRDLLTANNVDYDDLKVMETLRILPVIMRECVECGSDTYYPLMNAIDLLDVLSKRKDIVCGLLTGNIEEDVDIKLGNADPGFLQYFAKLDDGGYVGGFGSDHEQRDCLVPFAKRRYAQYLGVDEDVICNEKDLIIIGDTPRDIQCAHAHNVPAIGIATGHYSLQCLKDANADALLNDFGDIEGAINLLCTICFDLHRK